jgi:hypothetical protein
LFENRRKEQFVAFYGLLVAIAGIYVAVKEDKKKEGGWKVALLGLGLAAFGVILAYKGILQIMADINSRR